MHVQHLMLCSWILDNAYLDTRLARYCDVLLRATFGAPTPTLCIARACARKANRRPEISPVPMRSDSPFDFTHFSAAAKPIRPRRHSPAIDPPPCLHMDFQVARLR
jgi:hypothetical protein